MGQHQKIRTKGIKTITNYKGDLIYLASSA